MDDYNHDNGSGIFIQIGAGAGDLDKRANCRDGFTEFIKCLPRERIQKIILVEPNPVNIPYLKECWKDFPEATIYETAIVPTNFSKEYVEFFYCEKDAPNYQVASINKQHIFKHYGTNCNLRTIQVKAQNINSFISDVVDSEIELLSLDIEGIDAEIILDLSLKNINVKYISFEYIHLGNQLDSVKNHLQNNNFIYKGKGIDHSGYDYLYVKKYL